MNQKLLVFSAHAADYVWRSAGTIAKYIKAGCKVKLVILSLGVRGESNHMWKQPGQTYDNVAKIRREETERAASILGLTDVEIWNLQDYPMSFDEEIEMKIVKTIRGFRPDVILTHDKFDVLNPDHNLVFETIFKCSVMANSSGIITPGYEVTKQMKIFGFEPHQTEISNYKPDCFIDITDVADQKKEAMNCFQAQHHLIEYYTDRMSLRGNHARRTSGNQNIKYAESFSSYFPRTSAFFD